MKKGCNAFDDVDCSKPKSFEEFSCSSNNRGQRDLTLGALVSYYIEGTQGQNEEILKIL